MRQCPTVEGDGAPLIVQTIGAELCQRRQTDHYHKCHRCVFRGCAATDEEPPKARSAGHERNGVMIPRPVVAEPVAAPAMAAGRNGKHAPAATPAPTPAAELLRVARQR
jgi:hypothetical protein